MSTMKTTEEQRNGDYSKVVDHYAPPPNGLWGKYDNVRRFWENQISSFALQPALSSLRNKVGGLRGLRVLDLGCGSGEGWNLILHTPDPEAPVHDTTSQLLNESDVEMYVGIDLCADMVEVARERFRNRPNMRFETGDMAQLELRRRGIPPCDLYYSSYGGPSHLKDEDMVKMLTEIARHMRGHAVVVVDLLGQFSPEWPNYWGYSNKPGVEKLQPYNMSWLYPPEEQDGRVDEFSDYRIRYWSGREMTDFCKRTLSSAGLRNIRIRMVDRSILVGRHMDTSQFNGTAPSLRRAVNSLFDLQYRTCPTALRSTFKPPAHAPAEIARFHELYRNAWNGLVDVFHACFADTGNAPEVLAQVERENDLPPSVRESLEGLVQQASGIGWLKVGDPRSQALEPQFGLILRQLEFLMQRGLGCGHGLMAVLELER